MPVICFVVTHPTQFEVPFYKFVAQQGGDWRFEVIYSVAVSEDNKYDKELTRVVKWGFPLYEGYISHHLPANAGQEKIKQLLKKRNINILMTNGYKSGYENFVAAAKALSIYVVLRIDSVLLGKPFYERWLRKIMLASKYTVFDAFFSTGTVTSRYLNAMGITEKIFWFPYCTDNDFFSNQFDPKQVSGIKAKYQINPDEKVVVGICKFNERENPFDLLQSFCMLNDPALHLIMIGDGPQAEELKKFAAKYFHLKIHFPGYVLYTELPAWYHASDLFVHTALHEPWGVSVQEALAAGCRIVTSNRVGSAYDLIKEERNGFIYTVKHPLQLAVCLRKALSLSDDTFEETRNEVLSEWNYGRVWQQMQKAANIICKI